jgi:hypothetical protein
VNYKTTGYWQEIYIISDCDGNHEKHSGIEVMSHGDSEGHTATEHEQTEMLWEVLFECYHSQMWQQCKALGNFLKLNTVRMCPGCYYEVVGVN